MTWLGFYLLLKFWLPLITAFVLVIKGFLLAGKGISMWADSLLNNHLFHIEEANEKAAAAIVELSAYHKNSLDLQTGILHEIQEQRADIRTLTASL